MTLQVVNSPFDQKQTEILNQLLPTLTDAQKNWLAGYLAASQANASQAAPAPEQTATQQVATRTVTILYGSETGNSQELAEKLSEQLKSIQRDVTISCMDDYKPKKLKEVEDLFIVTATHGEGDPPDNAIQFHEFLHGRKAPKLDNVNFAVLSLGDESYEHFCQTGKDFDKRLEELGATRIHPRVDCDVDYEEPAEEWFTGVLDFLKKDNDTGTSATVTEPTPAEQPIYSKSNPYTAEVLDNIKLSGQGSNKETRHIEIALDGSNLSYEPGDCLAIYPKNDPTLVQQIINELEWNPEQTIPINKQGEIRSVQEALTSIFEITRLTKGLLEKAAAHFENKKLTKLLDEPEQVKSYIDGRDLLDLIIDYPPAPFEPSLLMQILRKIPARQYSISSSYKANEDEVHLTIATVRYNTHGRDRNGVCSGEIADRIKPGDQLNIYVHKNPNFKFPFDEETPVIMIGPGTGVAPFRGYIEEREELELKGKTWLFFGDQHFRSDFLYQVDWQNWLNKGYLSKMDVAFSRDTEEKVYVQHRMKENAQQLYEWLEAGAYFFVCGDEKRMAKDVHEALLAIVSEQGKLSQEQATEYINKLKQEKRYQRDVY
ncbi:assimilatory sulfite reductase (NADPH) flavoprotein subunit [Gracilibacillus caseinilyticus]|uniref:Assimilatory sulfite reductase (NADPH) flavoprotein subunit n=1 Tax=Gracilibacillus caseinilyticus TaxID=2932256 RepID=A0ABY4EZY6_9BACI|nr:assimilatory sulfite reductase (NADPH) flavoprotein subunit [Gracilibacillus caseinilyticus]UOQ49974.1 assimilatory sulfite reductase (NADPH) flavoprotein subunit [Gracilibacillus caseinilyticus]